MIDLSNGTDWFKIYDQSHVAQLNPNRVGKHYPIPSILIPSYLDSYTIAVSIETNQAKPTWKLGGNIYPLIEVANSDIGRAKYNKSYTVYVDEPTIIKLNQISSYYRILIDIPNWFVDVYVQAWVFRGVEPASTVEEQLNDIKMQLNKIEQSINTTGQ